MSGVRGPRGRGRTTAGRALAAGLVLGVAYVALAAASGHLSPLARRPLLDGLGPLMPYRWVSPPPEVADNEPPSPATFELPVRNGRTAPDVVVTPDAQVTMILDRGAVLSDHERGLARRHAARSGHPGPAPSWTVYLRERGPGSKPPRSREVSP